MVLKGAGRGEYCGSAINLWLWSMVWCIPQYLGAPELDSPVKGRGGKQVREVNGAYGSVAVDPSNGPMVPLKHLADACFAVQDNTPNA